MSFLHPQISLLHYHQPNQIQEARETGKDDLFQIIISTTLYLEVQKEQYKYFRSARKESPLT